MPLPGALGLMSVFQHLADWKELKGLKAHVVTEEIVTGRFGNFSLCANGLIARPPEIIRNF